jgi:periplasmic protein TonB
MKKIILFFAVVLLSLQVGFCQGDSIFVVYGQNDAVYPGGMQAFLKYIRENTKYPQKAKDAKIQGKVTVEFFIEKDGTVSDVKSVGKALGYGLDEEAVRLVKENPMIWIAAEQSGKKIRLRKTRQILFKLQ